MTRTTSSTSTRTSLRRTGVEHGVVWLKEALRVGSAWTVIRHLQTETGEGRAPPLVSVGAVRPVIEAAASDTLSG